jgi:uncharacterized protein YaaN involved in tellurite resistance
MDTDLQKIDEKIEAVLESVIFIKDTVAKTQEDLTEFKENTGMQFKMLEGHLNIIEQKLDDQIETHKDIPARVTALEVNAFAK